MALLAALGTVNYNGYTFNGSTSSRVQCRAVPDSSNRTTKFVEYLLTIRENVLPGALDPDTGNQFGSLRGLLTAPAQRLQFTSQGFGTFDINGPGGVVDVAYGPHPEIIEAIPLGAGQAWIITWRCTTRIPECSSGGAVYSGRPLAQNYDLEISRDENGYSTRTITGYIEIPATRNGRSVSDVADAYWDQVYSGIPMVVGFKRKHSRKLSEDKRTMTYQVIDMEADPVAFQPGVVDWDGEHEITTDTGGIKGVSRIAATYQMERGQPKRNALDRFINLVNSRVVAGLQYLDTGTIVPLRFVTRDHLSKREVSFELMYTYTVTDPNVLLAAAGLFAPIPDTDYNSWLGTVANSQSARGNAQLVYDRSSDAIIDLCGGPTTSSMRTSGQPGTEVTLRASTGFTASLPPPSQSYLDYHMAVRMLGTTNLDFQKPMTNTLSAGDYQQNQMTAQDPSLVPPPGARIINNLNYDQGSTQAPDVVDAQATGEWWCVLAGGALRAGYPVPVPNLLSVANVPAYLTDLDVNGGIAMNAGIPIYWGTWSLLYRFPSVPLTVPTPTNPVLHAQF